MRLEKEKQLKHEWVMVFISGYILIFFKRNYSETKKIGPFI